jgi:L-threonylcarbamoyladenylate synthase
VTEEFAQEILPGGLIAAVLDGGQSEVGIESTIVDLSRLATHGPVLLRPGQISSAQLADVLGVTPASPDAAAPRASGTLDAHYAPQTPVVQVALAELDNVAAQLQAKGKRSPCSVTSRIPESWRWQCGSYRQMRLVMHMICMPVCVNWIMPMLI